jgi:hypothetical protein
VKQIKKDTTKRENFSLSLLPIFSPLFPLLKKRGREGEEGGGKKKGKKAFSRCQATLILINPYLSVPFGTYFYTAHPVRLTLLQANPARILLFRRIPLRINLCRSILSGFGFSLYLPVTAGKFLNPFSI